MPISKKPFKMIKKSTSKESSGKDYVKAMDRLLTILSTLDKGKMVSTSNLADQLNVTQRSIQRDIERIENCGHPIVRPKPGMVAFQEGYSLRKVSLSEEQASLISFMSEIALSLGGKFEASFKELFKRLMATDMYTPYYAKLTIGGAALPNSKLVKDLESAIDNSDRIKLNYVSVKGSKDYVVEPLKLTCFDGFWYCIVKDKTDRRLLKLRIDRINTVELLDETFTPDVDIDKLLKESVNVWFDEVRGDRVLIKVSANTARFFKDRMYFPLQKVVSENKDGSIVLETFPAHSEEIMHTIMHWIPNLTVVEPESLKNEVKKNITIYLESIK